MPHLGRFDGITAGPNDPMFDLKARLDSNNNPRKIDLGAGVYRDLSGGYYELPVVKKAKLILESQNLGHDYEITTGNSNFIQAAQSLLFGQNSEIIASGRLASVQSISGTGANHLAAVFASKFFENSSRIVYIGNPAWGNYKPLFEHAGFETRHYQYYDEVRKIVAFGKVLEAARRAPKNSIFVLQGCCNNPCGMDMSQEQWKQLAAVLELNEHFPIIDIAYQGFGEGLEEDAFGLRHFVEKGFELMFSKNMGLYGERVGALHVVLQKPDIALRVVDQLRCIIRMEFSSSPAYGARIATIIMTCDKLYAEWVEELAAMRGRLLENRKDLHSLLTLNSSSSAKWQHILSEAGLFSFLDLTAGQVERLIQEFDIFLPSSGRIAVAGLSPYNIERVAAALSSILTDEQCNMHIRENE